MPTLPYLVVQLPIPHAMLSPNYTPNGKAGRDAERAQVALHRGWAKAVFKGARIRKKLATRSEVRWRPVFYHRVKRRRDDDNLTGSLKAYRDGFADALLIDNDSGIRNDDPVHRTDQNQRVVIEVYDAEGAKS